MFAGAGWEGDEQKGPWSALRLGCAAPYLALLHSLRPSPCFILGLSSSLLGIEVPILRRLQSTAALETPCLVFSLPSFFFLTAVLGPHFLLTLHHCIAKPCPAYIQLRDRIATLQLSTSNHCSRFPVKGHLRSCRTQSAKPLPLPLHTAPKPLSHYPSRHNGQHHRPHIPKDRALPPRAALH